jgi:beta-lactamase class C
MIVIKRLFLLLIFLIPLSGSEARAENPDPVASLLPRFEALVQTSMLKKNVPGLAIAIVSKGKIIYVKGFGIRAIGQPDPITKQTVFQLGSLSKAISSTLIAILKRENVLHLDHPMEFLPGTTLRHVLSHTTGIPSGGFNSLIERGGTREEAVRIIEGMTLEDAPGTKFSYHNLVYNFLVDAVEQQGGASFESTLQHKLFGPLNMTQTSSTWDSFMAAQNRAFPHTFKQTKGTKGKGSKKVVQKASYRVEYANYPAAGGISSTIEDMAQFLAAVLGARPEVITSQDLEEFITPVIHTPDQWHRTQKYRDRISKTQYGLGWRHMTFGDQSVVFHGGWVRGFCNTMAFLPEQDLGIIILQNAESSLASQLSMQFFDWILKMPPKNWIN